MWRPEIVPKNRWRDQNTGYRKQHDSYVEKKDKTYTENIILEPETERTIWRPETEQDMLRIRQY
jgi:hypothetical protein